MPGLKGLGVFFVIKFYFTEIQSFSWYTCKYNVWGIKFERKVMRFHEIRVEKLSSFLLNKYAVHDF